MTLTNDRDWGLKVWDDLEQKDVPKPVNCKTTLFNFLSGFRFAYPRRLTQKVLIQHFLGKRTVYFTGSRGERTLLMLDIDCHNQGRLRAQAVCRVPEAALLPRPLLRDQHQRQRHPRLHHRGHLELERRRLQRRAAGCARVAEKSPRHYRIRRRGRGTQGSVPGDLGAHSSSRPGAIVLTLHCVRRCFFHDLWCCRGRSRKA